MEILDEKVMKNIESTVLQYEMTGRFEKGYKAMSEQAKFYQRQGHELAEYTCNWGVGQMAMYSDKLDEATRNFAQVIFYTGALFDASKPYDYLLQQIETMGRIGLGRVNYLKGDVRTAARELNAANELATALDNVALQMQAVYWLGRNGIKEKDFKNAKDCFKHVNQLAGVDIDNIGNLDLGVGRVLAWNSMNLAQLEGKIIGQGYNIEKAVDYFNRIRDIDGAAVTTNKVGDICKNLGDKEKAIEWYDKSYNSYKSISYKRGMMNCLEASAELYPKEERYKRYKKALDIAIKLKLDKRVAGLKQKLAVC